MKKTDLQRYEMRQVLRSQLMPHPKNPRDISKDAQKKLKDKMRQVGLLQPIVVNCREDGQLVVLGGHQRLAVMDNLEGYSAGKNDYQLDVACVRLPESEELEMLVFLNNPSAQGIWNTDLLAELNQDFGVDFGSMGFDKIDVDLLFDGDGRFSDLFADTCAVSEAKDALREIKANRENMNERYKESNSAQFYFVVVCQDDDEKCRVLKSLGIPKYEEYVSGAAVLAAVG